MGEKSLSYVKISTLPEMPASVQIAVRLGEIMQAGAGRIASIDLNPVMVRAKGEGAVVADALIELI